MLPSHWLVSGQSEIQLVGRADYHMFRQLSADPIGGWVDSHLWGTKTGSSCLRKQRLAVWTHGPGERWYPNVAALSVARSGCSARAHSSNVYPQTTNFVGRFFIPGEYVPIWLSLLLSIWPTSCRPRVTLHWLAQPTWKQTSLRCVSLRERGREQLCSLRHKVAEILTQTIAIANNPS